VISPLLALQTDQLAGLNARADDRTAAVRISSAESPRQQDEALAALHAACEKRSASSDFSQAAALSINDSISFRLSIIGFYLRM